MSKRDWRIVLEDMVEAIDSIESYTKEVKVEQFTNEKMRTDAVVRNLEIIGEAAKLLPDEVKQKNKDVEWGKIVGLRNRIVHEYFDVDLEIVWFIATKELPSLKRQILAMKY